MPRFIVYRVPKQSWRWTALGFGCVRVSAGKAGNKPHYNQNRRPKAGRAGNWYPLGYWGLMFGAPGLSGVEYAWWRMTALGFGWVRVLLAVRP